MYALLCRWIMERTEEQLEADELEYAEDDSTERLWEC